MSSTLVRGTKLGVIEMLPALSTIAAKEKCQIVAFRPITLSSFTQANAAAFIEFTKDLGVKVIMVQTRGQGRTLKHFAPWEVSKLRVKALSMGAVETYMSDVGVKWADEIPSFGITFDEVARGDFSRVMEVNRADAEKIFDEDLQSHMALWLDANVNRFRAALTKVESCNERMAPPRKGADCARRQSGARGRSGRGRLHRQ